MTQTWPAGQASPAPDPQPAPLRGGDRRGDGRRARRAGLTDLVRIDAAGEGYTPPLAWMLFWLPLASLAALLAIAVIFRPAYDRILQEDYPVEWSQFALCLFICAVAFMSIRPAVRERRWLIAGLLVLAGVGFFFLAGEEISWGQRVFGIVTPADFSGNAQDETNLHNFTAGTIDIEAVFRQVQLGMSIVAGGLVVLRFTGLRSGSFWRMVAPPLFTLPLQLSMAGYRVYRLFVPGEVNFAVRLQEWAEFCQYLGLAIGFVCLFFALRSPGCPAGGTAHRTGRGVEAGDVAARDRRSLAVPVGVITLITVVFAVMTLFSSVRAYN